MKWENRHKLTERTCNLSDHNYPSKLNELVIEKLRCSKKITNFPHDDLLRQTTNIFITYYDTKLIHLINCHVIGNVEHYKSYHIHRIHIVLQCHLFYKLKYIFRESKIVVKNSLLQEGANYPFIYSF